MDDSSDSFLQGQSPDDSSGERPKTLAVTTIGKSGDSRAPQVRSVHCPDSGQAEQSRGVTVECDDAVAAVGLDNESSSSSAASGMTVLEEDAEESSAPSRVAVAQLADSAKCHGDKVLQSGSLIHQPHKKGKVPAMLPTSESTIQDNQDQDFQIRPNGKNLRPLILQIYLRWSLRKTPIKIYMTDKLVKKKLLKSLVVRNLLHHLARRNLIGGEKQRKAPPERNLQRDQNPQMRAG